MPEPVVICFSGGKDSVLALRAIHQQRQYEAVALLTTVTSDYERVSIHGVRRNLLRAQAASLGLPLTEVAVPPMSTNETYERAMGRAFRQFRADGIRRIAFGDIALEDLRIYRELQVAACHLECLFPLWHQDTTELAHTFIREGFEGLVVCVDPTTLDASFAGRAFDEALLADLPPAVDPCGENGEFYTFVSSGPIFKRPIPVSPATVVRRAGLVYCDVLPKGEPS